MTRGGQDELERPNPISPKGKLRKWVGMGRFSVYTCKGYRPAWLHVDGFGGAFQIHRNPDPPERDTCLYYFSYMITI